MISACVRSRFGGGRGCSRGREQSGNQRACRVVLKLLLRLAICALLRAVVRVLTVLWSWPGWELLVLRRSRGVVLCGFRGLTRMRQWASLRCRLLGGPVGSCSSLTRRIVAGPARVRGRGNRAGPRPGPRSRASSWRHTRPWWQRLRSRRSTFPGLEALGYDLRLSPAAVGVPALEGDPRAAGYCGASLLLFKQLLIRRMRSSAGDG